MPDVTPIDDERRLAARVVHGLSSAADVDAAVDWVLREVAGRLGADLAALWTLDEAAGLLRWQRDWARSEATDEVRRLAQRLTFGPGTGLPGRALERGEPVWVEDLRADPGFARADAAGRCGLRWAAAAPLPGMEGTTGVIEFLGAGARAGTPSELDGLAMAGRQLGAYLGRLRIEDRLRATEESSASIVQAALDCIITMDHRGRVLDFNPAAEETFGYAREETIGRQLADLIIPPHLRDAHQQALREHGKEKRASILNQRLELEGMRADGSTFPVELTVTRLGRRDPPVFAGFIRDIGERRALEAEQSRLLREALLARAQAEAAGLRTQDAREEAERALAEAERARGRLAFLARAGRTMAESMDWDATLRTVAGVAVPVLADWAALTLVDPGGRLRVVAVEHHSPERRELVWALARRPAAADDPLAPSLAIATHELQLVEAPQARDDEHRRLLREVGSGPAVVAPLVTGSGAIGAITLGMAYEGRGFAPDDLQVIGSFAARAALHVQNARLYRERSHIAKTLQASLRPRALPPVPGLEIAARFLPAGDQNEVGGDFYDLFPSGDEGVWAAVVGDVSGKGAEAAAITALARHTLRTGAMLHDDPSANLALLNRAMLTQISDRAFCTLVYVRVCRCEGGGVDLRIANGGHPAPLLARADGTVEAVEVGRGPLVGALADAVFEDGRLHLDPGDLLLLYTDGVTEIRTSDPSLGDRELRRIVEANAGASVDALVDAVERRAVELQQGPPRDDIALLALRAT